MRVHILNRYLLSSVCFAAADDARAKAEAAKKKQADDEAKKAEDEAGKTDGADKPPADGGAAQGAEEAMDAGTSPKPDGESIDVASLLTRLDAQDRLIATMSAQMAGTAGPATGENKDVTAVSPGAAFDPRMTRVLPDGVSSAPSTGPIPAGANSPSTALAATSARAAWGLDAKGEPVKARSYPGLDETDVMVVAAGYYEDQVRNPGEIIRGYSGPAGSWFVPLDLYNEEGREGAIAEFKRWRDRGTRANAA